MHATEEYRKNEHRLEVSVTEARTREMEDVLSRRLPLWYKSAHRFPGKAADADYAVQDALLSAYKHLNQFRGQAQMSTW
jgi:DNA-directed RNA polymerase specialized sigma24 family protein